MSERVSQPTRDRSTHKRHDRYGFFYKVSSGAPPLDNIGIVSPMAFHLRLPDRKPLPGSRQRDHRHIAARIPAFPGFGTCKIDLFHGFKCDFTGRYATGTDHLRIQCHGSAGEKVLAQYHAVSLPDGHPQWQNKPLCACPAPPAKQRRSSIKSYRTEQDKPITASVETRFSTRCPVSSITYRNALLRYFHELRKNMPLRINETQLFSGFGMASVSAINANASSPRSCWRERSLNIIVKQTRRQTGNTCP